MFIRSAIVMKLSSQIIHFFLTVSLVAFLSACFPTPSVQPFIAADAGMDLTIPGKSRTYDILDGSNSSSSGTIEVWAWQQLSGPAVILSAASTPNPNFVLSETSIQSEILSFELSITDSNGQSDTDIIQIELIPPPALSTLYPVSGSVQICAPVDDSDCQ